MTTASRWITHALAGPAAYKHPIQFLLTIPLPSLLSPRQSPSSLDMKLHTLALLFVGAVSAAPAPQANDTFDPAPAAIGTDWRDMIGCTCLGWPFSPVSVFVLTPLPSAPSPPFSLAPSPPCSRSTLVLHSLSSLPPSLDQLSLVPNSRSSRSARRRADSSKSSSPRATATSLAGAGRRAT